MERGTAVGMGMARKRGTGMARKRGTGMARGRAIGTALDMVWHGTAT